MWAKLASTVLLIGSGAASAQSAPLGVAGLEACSQAAHFADVICSKITDDPAQRLQCFKKSSADQLDCLEHALSDASPGAAPPDGASELVRSEPPANKPAAAPAETASPKQPGGTPSSDSGNTAASSGGAAVAQEARKEPSKEASRETLKQPSKGLSDARAQVTPPVQSAEAPAVAVKPDPSPKAPESPVRPIGNDWLVSETTSPIDYSPLVTAVIHPVSDAKGEHQTLAVRCRGQHTEFMLRTDGAWSAARGNELQVAYQVNDQPVVRLPWVLSADGKTATCKGDPTTILQSMPDGARLKIGVTDRASSPQAVTYQLDGWGAVRKKIAAACKWAQTTDEAASGRR
ncbi:hypothetical protein [Bradyrhizobium sp.]|uniref:hypothetical protein n=1 Tax=Bradyrhizobium sp. TaxID=376 RepID=UPI003C5A215A